jgi:hypothetical protein
MSTVEELLQGGGKSWAPETPGAEITGTVESTEVQQQTDLDTDEPVFWDPAKTRPKMMIVASLVDTNQPKDGADDDGRRTVFFTGNKFTALKAATKSLNKGDWVRVVFTGFSDREPAKKGYSPAKLYRVEHRAGNSGVDLSGETPAAAPAAPSPASTSAPTAASHGPKPDYLPQPAWDAMPAEARAAVSPPQPAGPSKPDYLPQEAWDKMTPEQQKAVAGF